MVNDRLGAAEAQEQERLTRMLIALADGQRRAILRLIRDRELRPSEILDWLGEDCRSLSYHLRILRDSQLVHVEAEGREHRYRLNKQACQMLAKKIEWVAGLIGHYDESIPQCCAALPP